MKRALVCFLIIFITITFVIGFSQAEVNLPEGFILDHVSNLRGHLESIQSSEYGFGVVVATIEKGILQVNLISQSSITLIASKPGFPINSSVWDVEFDEIGIYSNKLLISISNGGVSTQIVQVLENGNVVEKASIGNVNDQIGMKFVIVDEAAGYLEGAYLFDTNSNHGSNLYRMDTEFNLHKISDNIVPNNRTDLDHQEMKFDITGLYGGYITISDYDLNSDELTGIYQFLPDLSWKELVKPVNCNDAKYTNIKFSSGGDFGKKLYVINQLNNSINIVNSDGELEIFASGFDQPSSIAISTDGNHMFVSENNGIFRIRKSTTSVGPKIVMREPKVMPDDVHSGYNGVEYVRILWSDAISFEENDIKVTDENGLEIQKNVQGNNTQFMLISFGKILLDNKYTITISDEVCSYENYSPIDGDNDGIAGGVAIFSMEHRNIINCDKNKNGLIGLDDCIGILQTLIGSM